jgi:hypothetical protein
MKKNLMLLMLGLAFSFGSFANNEVKKENEKLTIKTIFKKTIKVEQKLFTEYCVNVTVYWGDCPDGSSYIAGFSAVLGTCSSNGSGEVATVLAYGFAEGDSYSDACD